MSNDTSFPKRNYVYKRFRVKKTDGKSTTVSVHPNLVIKACQTMGNLSSVSKVVREAALNYDVIEERGKNRSAHVSQRLKELVAHTGQPAAVRAPEAIPAVSSETAAAA